MNKSSVAGFQRVAISVLVVMIFASLVLPPQVFGGWPIGIDPPDQITDPDPGVPPDTTQPPDTTGNLGGPNSIGVSLDTVIDFMFSVLQVI